MLLQFYLLFSEYELWCGETDGIMNVFELQNSAVTSQHTLSHYQSTIPLKGLNVSLLESSDIYVYSYVAPGCVLYQWNASTKSVENKLDCSKLVPCSESLKSIAIEEHLSPGKCQITALAVLDTELYIGTMWGCVIIAEKNTLRPITIFRPFQEDVRTIIALNPIQSLQTPLVVTIGRGYRSLIDRFTDVQTGPVTTPGSSMDKKTKELLQKDRSNHMHALIWRADHWPLI